jgi:hypothetical protein
MMNGGAMTTSQRGPTRWLRVVSADAGTPRLGVDHRTRLMSLTRPGSPSAPRQPIRDHTKLADADYDPFLGPCTTLSAAERHARACYGFEIWSLYRDMILARWERFSGRAAERIERCRPRSVFGSKRTSFAVDSSERMPHS